MGAGLPTSFRWRTFCYGRYIPRFSISSPNPELNTERGWSSEIAIKQGFKLGDNFRGYIDFATFLNEFDEYVEYVPGIYENVNPETGDTLYVGEGPLVFGIRPREYR